MSNRALQVGGLAVLGGVGYYMYKAGGDPKAAQKHAEGTSPFHPPMLPLTDPAQPMRRRSRTK